MTILGVYCFMFIESTMDGVNLSADKQLLPSAGEIIKIQNCITLPARDRECNILSGNKRSVFYHA